MAKAKVVSDLRPDTTTRDNIDKIAVTRLEELYSWDAYVDDPYAIHELHALRISAKRLRYTLELFAQALPEEARALVANVEQIQEKLGALHDCDVLIALLRLTLGTQDSGPAYEKALMKVVKRGKAVKAFINPAILAHLVDPTTAPSARERLGLELLLEDLQRQRKALYADFRRYWYALKGKDFRRSVLSILDVV